MTWCVSTDFIFMDKDYQGSNVEIYNNIGIRDNLSFDYDYDFSVE